MIVDEVLIAHNSPQQCGCSKVDWWKPVETEVGGFGARAATGSLALKKCERNDQLRIMEPSDCC